MNKADYKFHRDKKEQILNNSKQSEERGFMPYEQNTRPIFIPKRKKKK